MITDIINNGGSSISIYNNHIITAPTPTPTPTLVIATGFTVVIGCVVGVGLVTVVSSTRTGGANTAGGAAILSPSLRPHTNRGMLSLRFSTCTTAWSRICGATGCTCGIGHCIRVVVQWENRNQRVRWAVLVGYVLGYCCDCGVKQVEKYLPRVLLLEKSKKSNVSV
jgi:hypothetical protein